MTVSGLKGEQKRDIVLVNGMEEIYIYIYILFAFQEISWWRKYIEREIVFMARICWFSYQTLSADDLRVSDTAAKLREVHKLDMPGPKNILLL